MRILEKLPTSTELFSFFTSKERSLKKDTVKIYFYQGLSVIVGIISTIFIARTLGPKGKGIVDLFILLTGLIVEFGLLGVNSGFFFYLTNQHKPLDQIHGSAIGYSLIFGIGVAIIGTLFISFWQALFSGVHRNFILLAFLLTPFLFYRGLWQNLIIGINLAPVGYKFQFLLTAASAVGIILLWQGRILTSRSAIYLIAGIVLLACLVSFIVLGRNNDFHLRFSKPLVSDSLRYGLKIYPGFIANFLHFRIDQLMINWFIGASGVGLYALSVEWGEALWRIDFGIINAALYRIASQDDKNSYFLTKKVFKWVLILDGVVGLFLIVICKPLFALLYGAKFNASVLPLILLIPGVVAWGGGRALSQYIAFNRGKPALCTLAAFIGMGFNIVGNLFAIPKWGIKGAAVTSTISYFLTMLFLMIVFRRKVSSP